MNLFPLIFQQPNGVLIKINYFEQILALYTTKKKKKPKQKTIKKNTSESVRLPERPGPPGWQRRPMMSFISASMALLLSIRAIVSDFKFVATILCADAYQTPFFVLRLCFERWVFFVTRRGMRLMVGSLVKLNEIKFIKKKKKKLYNILIPSC